MFRKHATTIITTLVFSGGGSLMYVWTTHNNENFRSGDETIKQDEIYEDFPYFAEIKNDSDEEILFFDDSRPKISDINKNKKLLKKKKDKLDNYRNAYKESFIHLLKHIISLQEKGYVRVDYLDENDKPLYQYQDIYGYFLEYNTHAYINEKRYIYDKNSPFYNPLYEKSNETFGLSREHNNFLVWEGKYFDLPTIYNFDVDHSNETTLKGFGLSWYTHKYQVNINTKNSTIVFWKGVAWSFIDVEQPERIKKMGRGLLKITNHLTDKLNSYKDTVKKYCSSLPAVLDYSDSQECLNKEYDKIKDINY